MIPPTLDRIRVLLVGWPLHVRVTRALWYRRRFLRGRRQHERCTTKAQADNCSNCDRGYCHTYAVIQSHNELMLRMQCHSVNPPSQKLNFLNSTK